MECWRDTYLHKMCRSYLRHQPTSIHYYRYGRPGHTFPAGQNTLPVFLMNIASATVFKYQPERTLAVNQTKCSRTKRWDALSMLMKTGIQHLSISLIPLRRPAPIY